MATERFQVDLAGLVQLLSHHLYSGPGVYLRELLQNGVDAIAARHSEEPEAPASIHLAVASDADGRPILEVADTGIGLTADQAADLLATIGRSSKRDGDLGLARGDFLGQFGIGLLACFLVADTIEVRSRARDATRGIVWRGSADGTFTIDDADSDDVGTTVRLVARPGMEHWLGEDMVAQLARHYAEMLPVRIAMRVTLADGQQRTRLLTRPDVPWHHDYGSPAQRVEALSQYCEETLGFTPMAAIDLHLPAAGLSGVAYVLPQQVAPGSGHHRCYIKRMLLSERTSQLVPEWAFFVRCVVTSDTLTPTASREELQEDETLLAVREHIGRAILQWLVQLLDTPTNVRGAFLTTHHLALRAVALEHDEVLELLAATAPFETTMGPQTLQAAARQGELLYTDSTEGFRRVATVARAQSLVVVNAGYVYDTDILHRLARRGWHVRQLQADDVTAALTPPVDPDAFAVALARAEGVLAPFHCDVVVRGFEPTTSAALLLTDAEREPQRDLGRERTAQPGLWSGLLDSFATHDDRRTLVFNHHNDLAHALLMQPEQHNFAAGVRAVYLSALMMSGEPLQASDIAQLNDALHTLLRHSFQADS